MRQANKSNKLASRERRSKQTEPHLSQPQKRLPYFILNAAPAARRAQAKKKRENRRNTHKLARARMKNAENEMSTRES